jgi:hypothetical protein
MKAKIAGAITLALAVICFAAPSHAQTITFTAHNGEITTENGVQIAAGYYFLPNQSSGFVPPDGGMSLYLPDETFEIGATWNSGIESNPTRGQLIIDSYYQPVYDKASRQYVTLPKAAHETDGFTFEGWTATIQREFTYTLKYTAGRCHCEPGVYIAELSDSGTLTYGQ